MYLEKLKNQFWLKKLLFCKNFVNNFLELLICKINVFSTFRMVDFLTIFVSSKSIYTLDWEFNDTPTLRNTGQHKQTNAKKRHLRDNVLQRLNKFPSYHNLDSAYLSILTLDRSCTWNHIIWDNVADYQGKKTLDVSTAIGHCVSGRYGLAVDWRSQKKTTSTQPNNEI